MRSLRDMRTIVLVEDNEPLRDLLQFALARAGYRVLPAGNSNDALTVSDQVEEDGIVFLTDVTLPGMKGPELATEFVRRHPSASVAFMSGYNCCPTIAAPSVLLKPFSIAELLAFVEQIGEKRSSKYPHEVP
jgi:two-component system, cell cycle sensor histidine kinase and response regulator CckA